MMKNNSISVRADDAEAAKIKRICKQHAKTSVSDVVRAAIRAYQPSAKSLEAVRRLQGAAAYDREKRVAAGRKGGEAKAARESGRG